ncbi:MAG: class 1 fructose-bisphosphatase [Actinomycetota bacterium]
MTQRITLTQFLHEGQRNVAGATGDFTGLVVDIAIASKAIANAVGKGALLATGSGLSKALRTLASDLLLEQVSVTSQLAATFSRDVEGILQSGRRGRYLLTVVPLSSSTNLDVNSQTGTIFSILRAPDPDRPAREEDFRTPGRDLECAGIVQYGGSTRLVLATGLGVDGFTLDRELGEYVVTHPHITLPTACSEVSVHAVGSRSWEPPVNRYVRECVAGVDGPRSRDFRMRWSSSLVADSYRILTRGGVFLHPHDASSRHTGGHLRLLTEVNPVAWMVEQAGGRAITGRNDILGLQPTEIGQRVPFIFGSRDEVDRLHAYHRDHTEGRDSEDEELPLFSTRSLFR